MSDIQHKTVVVGPEYDEGLRGVLMDVLLRLGARGLSNEWAVGGSQEIATVEVQVGTNRVVIEAETYIGLSITGPSDLVDRICSLVNEQLPNGVAG